MKAVSTVSKYLRWLQSHIAEVFFLDEVLFFKVKFLGNTDSEGFVHSGNHEVGEESFLGSGPHSASFIMPRLWGSSINVGEVCRLTTKVH